MTRKYSLPIFFSKNLLLPKLFSLALLALLLNSCIEEFNPELDGSVELVVIDGKIIKGDSIQQVVVSRSTPINNNEFKPIKSCTVWVVDNANRTFYFEEKSDGLYQAEIPEEYLAYNSRFKLRITTPDKNEYESDYETILESSPIDSVYYGKESYQSSSEQSTNGLQFYTDLNAPDENTKNYRWKVLETYEYTSRFLIFVIWNPENETIYGFDPPTDSLYYCWSTSPINKLFTSSTENLITNQKKKIPLNYVSGDSYKLARKYSILVQQFALSNAAYVYWDKNKVQASESGGLYQTQPSQSKSNIRNLNNPNEIVLGFFWASSFTEKRAFFNGPFNKSFDYRPTCYVDTFSESLESKETYTLLTAIGWDEYGGRILATSSPECLDCREMGGTIIKPDFWE